MLSFLRRRRQSFRLFLYLGFAFKHFPHGLEVSVAIHVIGLEIARFRPLIPAVDRYERHGQIVRIHVCLRLQKCFLDIFGGVICCDKGLEGTKSRIVIPPERNLRKIKHPLRIHHIVALLVHLDELGVISVTLLADAHIIVRNAVKIQDVKRISRRTAKASVIIKAFKGIRPVVVALIGVPMIDMLKATKMRWWSWIVWITSMVLVCILSVSPIYILICVIVVAAFISWHNNRRAV